MDKESETPTKKLVWTNDETKQFLELLRDGLVNGEKIKEKIYRDILANHPEDFKGRTTESLRKKLTLEKLAHQKTKSYGKGTGGGPLHESPLTILRGEVFTLLGLDEVLPDAIHNVAPFLFQDIITTECESDSSKENFLVGRSSNVSNSRSEGCEKYASSVARENRFRDDINSRIAHLEQKLDNLRHLEQKLDNLRNDIRSDFKEDMSSAIRKIIRQKDV